MGTDIHSIVEIKKNDKWEYIYDIPDVFNNRSYGVFSILNCHTRHQYGFDGFEAKGLPKDLSVKRCRFVSQRNELENAFNKTDFVCYIESENRVISIFDECLTTEIDFDTYEELSSELVGENKKRYYYPRQAMGADKYYVQDAQKVNGVFKRLPFKEFCKTIDEFNKQYYNYKWVEEEQDYGFYEVDFLHPDFYGHSYLTLAELKSKIIVVEGEETYQIDKQFLDRLLFEIEELPEDFVVKNTVGDKVNIVWSPDSYTTNVYALYSDGVKEIEMLKEKYNITNDENIRIVFAFEG